MARVGGRRTGGQSGEPGEAVQAVPGHREAEVSVGHRGGHGDFVPVSAALTQQQKSRPLQIIWKGRVVSVERSLKYE